MTLQNQHTTTGENVYFILLRRRNAGTAPHSSSSSSFLLLADAFEALIGALYLDSGYQACDTFINKYLITKLSEIITSGSYKDAKSEFQEQAQDKDGITPVYKIVKEWGPDHKKKFVVGVFLHETLITEGEGYSKQEAEEEAAKKALQIKNWK